MELSFGRDFARRTLVLAFTSFLVAPSLRAESAFLQKPHATLRSKRWEGVVRQAFDYSCGTGSIANLLALYQTPAVTEQEMVNLYVARRSRAEVELAMREGFSLLDLQNILEALGHHAEGVKFESGTLPEDPEPLIVYLVVKGYRHFCVFAGIEQGEILLLDPARGRIRITVARFLSEWDGSALRLISPSNPIHLAESEATALQSTLQQR